LVLGLLDSGLCFIISGTRWFLGFYPLQEILALIFKPVCLFLASRPKDYIAQLGDQALVFDQVSTITCYRSFGSNSISSSLNVIRI